MVELFWRILGIILIAGGLVAQRATGSWTLDFDVTNLPVWMFTAGICLLAFTFQVGAWLLLLAAVGAPIMMVVALVNGSSWGLWLALTPAFALTGWLGLVNRFSDGSSSSARSEARKAITVGPSPGPLPVDPPPVKPTKRTVVKKARTGRRIPSLELPGEDVSG